MSTYCTYCEAQTEENVHKIYHDTLYGFPLTDDDELFERLILEINQAGLSWDTILKKQANFKEAYSQFSIQKVANYQETDRERLLSDVGIIRNRLKVDAAIYNAQQILKLQKEFGSFYFWLQQYDWIDKKESIKIFKKHFKFVGGEIVNEFLMSIGFRKGAHEQNCFIFAKILEEKPFWLTIEQK
jgi:DNA-3-methyladenine glycosylase I